MATIMLQSELARRALAYLDARRLEKPEASLMELLDEAGMRFNLNPLEAGQLERLFRDILKEDGRG